MKIYREDDFKPKDFWEIFVPGYKPGETSEDVAIRVQKLLEETGVAPIAVTDTLVHCGDIIRISGEVYHVGICGVTMCAVVGPVKIADFPPTMEDEDELSCPFCGYKPEDAFELPDSGDNRCPRCGGLYRFEKEIEVRWNSYPVEAAQIKDI